MTNLRDWAFVRMFLGIGLEIVGFVKSLARHWIIWLLLLGVILMVLSKLDWTKNLQIAWTPSAPWLLEMFDSLGKLIVASGVFTAITKSTVFLDIFKSVVQDQNFQLSVRTALLDATFVDHARSVIRDELISDPSKQLIREQMASVVLGDDFLEEWQAKWIAWERLARAVFASKLPGIHDEVQRKISEDFFPQENDYYLRNYHVEIQITLREDGRIQIEDLVNFEIQPGPSAEVVCSYRLDRPHEVTDFRLLELEVDGEDRRNEFRTETMGYHFSLRTQDRYQVRRKTSRNRPFVHSIEGPSHSIRFNRFVKIFDVRIRHSPKLSIFLTERGTSNKLEDVQTDEVAGLQSLRRKYNGVLLPNWGLHITWTLKPSEGES